MDEYKVEIVNKNKLQEILNRLTREGWHIWPQCIYFDAPNHFIVVVSKTKEEKQNEQN